MTDRAVLITGAAGLFGGILRRHWGARYRLRLSDIRPVDDLAPHEQFVAADIVDYGQLLKACQGMHTVVHLAAYPGDGAEFYDTLLNLNIIGAYNAFQAAHEAGCRRLVFASSVDVVKGYWDEGEIPLDVPIYPTNLYGASKSWGEALARVYAHQHGLSCICVRLCNPGFDQAGTWDAEDFISGMSRRDAASLLALCVEADSIDFAVVNGISNHRHGRLDLKGTRQILGFEPEDGTAFPRRH
jgi:NAD+ dependent glucose-6-phosphate dehydrogenase